ncbi:hypothetical protein ABT373_36655 [Streptomyces sp. NPDC000070]|uniref:hypothetical protein n=1 Tax=Streptomyces sp. NPDC000070 TaxID=3154240 RepID=UPI0033212C19
MVMELSAQAGPGVEKAAEQAVESACHLADLAGPDGWRTVAAEDVLDAIDTLTDTLGSAGEELVQALAVVTAATAEARRRLGIAAEDQAPGREARRRCLYRVARDEGPPGVAGSVRVSGASVQTTKKLFQIR